jgi:hypothetical protein
MYKMIVFLVALASTSAAFADTPAEIAVQKLTEQVKAVDQRSRPENALVRRLNGAEFEVQSDQTVNLEFVVKSYNCSTPIGPSMMAFLGSRQLDFDQTGSAKFSTNLRPGEVDAIIFTPSDVWGLNGGLSNPNQPVCYGKIYIRDSSLNEFKSVGIFSPLTRGWGTLLFTGTALDRN